MTTYAKLSVRSVLSDNSDYSAPTYDSEVLEFTSSSDRAEEIHMLIPLAGVTLYANADLTSIEHLVVYNEDATNFLTLIYEDAAATTQTLIVEAGGFVALSNVSATANITVAADTAACLARFFLVGTA